MVEEKSAGLLHPAKKEGVPTSAPNLPLIISRVSGVRIWGKYASERSIRFMMPKAIAKQFYGRSTLNAFLGLDDIGNVYVLISVGGRLK